MFSAVLQFCSSPSSLQMNVHICRRPTYISPSTLHVLCTCIVLLRGIVGHWVMKYQGGQEDGYCTKMVSDRGDWCLFAFYFFRRLFFNVFPFPFCKAQLIGNCHENRRGARNCLVRQSIMLSKANSYVGDVASVRYLPTQGAAVRHYFGAPMSPSANRKCWPDTLRQ